MSGAVHVFFCYYIPYSRGESSSGCEIPSSPWCHVWQQDTTWRMARPLWCPKFFSLLQLWEGSVGEYKSVGLTAECTGLRLMPLTCRHRRPSSAGNKGVHCWNLIKLNSLWKYLHVWRWCFLGGVLGRTPAMPPSVMKSTDKQCKVPLVRLTCFCTFSS